MMIGVPSWWEIIGLIIGATVLITFLFSLVIGNYTIDTKTGEFGYQYKNEQRKCNKCKNYEE